MYIQTSENNFIIFTNQKDRESARTFLQGLSDTAIFEIVMQMIHNINNVDILKDILANNETTSKMSAYSQYDFLLNLDETGFEIFAPYYSSKQEF